VWHTCISCLTYINVSFYFPGLKHLKQHKGEKIFLQLLAKTYYFKDQS
jgi:hypothetical protein